MPTQQKVGIVNATLPWNNAAIGKTLLIIYYPRGELRLPLRKTLNGNEMLNRSKSWAARISRHLIAV